MYYRFCRSNPADITIENRKGLTIFFTSNDEDTGGGSQCIAECVEGKDEDPQSSTLLQSNGKNATVVTFQVLQL